MSKFVKDMITKDLRNRLEGVEDALLVDVIGLKNDKCVALRQRLRKKSIHLLVIKNSLAARATQGTRLEKAFDNSAGQMALIWGGEDIISLAKEVITIADDKNFAPFAPKGGVMDGQSLAAEQVRAVSKWPSRKEQLSILSGQILSVGANLSSQLLSAGSKLASQIKKKSEEEGGETAGAETAVE
jgi:large subunit ribosomal protein L10